MPRLRLDGVSIDFPGPRSPYSLAGLLPAFCLAARTPILNNVALDSNDGERLAVLGKGASGKSVLLRLLSGRLSPTAGTCTVEGSVCAIVDVESCLDADATGEQNLTRLAGDLASEARRLAGLDDLLDVPVRYCSPGMRRRLGFAALAARPADILLVDDCVRQADLAFRPMMISRLKQLIDRAKVAVIAEPSLMVRCNRFVELVGGRLLALEKGRAAA